jgi:2,3-bisphosphoglycerate-dependent phosphoglycerate mutase
MKLLITALVLVFSISGITISGINSTAENRDTTTIIVVRHAEKVDDSTDPELSYEGELRAMKLAEMLKKIQVDVIYSTNYKRTLATVTPVSVDKNLKIELYDPRNEVEYSQIFENSKGKTILIAGHSNTVPMTANFYLGEDRLEKFDESDYGNFLILLVNEIGDAKLIHLTY